MAIKKNKKRIDPRYFLNETTYRDSLNSDDPIWRPYIIKEEVAGALKTEVSREVRDQRQAELSARSARKARRGEHEDSIQNRIDISKTRSSDLDCAEIGYDGSPAAADARRERRDLLDKIERLEKELQTLRGKRR